MSITYHTVRAHALSLVGALFFATLMVGAATPIFPVA